MSKRKVLVIGWDAADWKVIKPLIAEGKMPTLAKFLSQGSYGRAKTLDPPLSPMLWTSMATGYRADKHGITGFIEPTPDNSGMRPVTSTSRKVKAIWNIFHHKKMKSNVIGWWPSNPVEPINGVMVSNLYQSAPKNRRKWVMPDGTVHPDSFKDKLGSLRVHPAEMTAEMMTPFLPNLSKMDKDDKVIGSVAKILAHAATIHAASTYVMKETEWDFMAIYHDAIDHFSHTAMKFHPPHREGIPEEMYENYNQVVRSGYMFHDMMLNRTLQLVDDDTTVIIISDHGFHPDHLRPRFFIKEPAAPAQEHSPYGIFCVKGPGIKKDYDIGNVSILDLTPTLLNMYGLPVGKNMEGEVITRFYEEERKVDFIEDWEKVEGDFGMHPKDKLENAWDSHEAMQQLVELGYIDAPGEDISKRIESSKLESKYYVARNLIDAGKVADGTVILEEIFVKNPKEVRYGQRLAHCYLQLRNFRKCKDLIEKLKVLSKEREAEYQALSDEEKEKRDKSFMKEIELPNYIDFVEGQLLMHLNKYKKAQKLLDRVEENNPNSLQVYLQIGRLNLHKKRWVKAQDAFVKALSIDESVAFAHYGLGVSFLRRRMINEALEEFFIALELNPNNANVHYHLGEAFIINGNKKEAVEAFKVASHISPGMAKAHKWLIDLYTNEFKDDEMKSYHQSFIDGKIKGVISIVTGLPNSGQEQVKNLLEQNNCQVYNTKDSAVDEKIERLSFDKKFLADVEDKVLFVPLNQISYLPAKYDYKILYLKRDSLEVFSLESLNVDEKNEERSDRKMKKLNADVLNFVNWIDTQPDLDIMEVNFNELSDNTDDIETFFNK